MGNGLAHEYECCPAKLIDDAFEEWQQRRPATPGRDCWPCGVISARTLTAPGTSSSRSLLQPALLG